MRRAGMALVLLACAEEPKGDDTASTPALGCELGTGYEAFEPLASGDEVTIVAGPQGGYHIYTSVRMTELVGPNVTVTGNVRLASSGKALGPGFAVADALEIFDGEAELIGMLNLLSDPEEARGQEVILTVTVEDGGSGERADDARTVVAI